MSHIMAFFLPGFVVLLGLQYLSPTIYSWLHNPSVSTLGLTILMAGAIGYITSVVRWFSIDTLIFIFFGHSTPKFESSKLENCLPAFQHIIDQTYRYYQNHANTLVALIFTFSTRILTGFNTTQYEGWITFCTIFSCSALFFGAKDCMKKYVERVCQLSKENV